MFLCLSKGTALWIYAASDKLLSVYWLGKVQVYQTKSFYTRIINLTEQLDGRDSMAQKWEEVQDNILVQEWHFKPLLSDIGLDILSLETDVLMMKTSHQNCFEP